MQVEQGGDMFGRGNDSAGGKRTGSLQSGRHRSRLGRHRDHRRRLSLIALGLVASLVVMGIALALNVGGFEIDAGNLTPADALYSGNEGGADWALGASNNSVFVPSTAAPHTATPGGDDCYGSNIDFGSAAGTSAFICDGNSDHEFANSDDEEANVVSPSGKSPDDQWPIKPGNVRPKNDFSHAYVNASLVDSPCDTDTIANNVVLHLGGHVGDNEGDHFWGFEFDKLAPGGFANLVANNGAQFTLDFNRTLGDFLVSFTVPGNASNPVVLEVFTVTGFITSGPNTGDAIFTLAGGQPGCPSGQPQGLTTLATNAFNDVTAPPWNVPVCDPTADNGANQCRVANGTTLAEDLLAPRDFAEGSVDLTAFGITPCVSNIIFSSRSAHVLEGADVQDVGAADFPLCGKKAGTKFHDLNADGDQDTGESGLANWPINLYKDADNSDSLNAADDSDGNASNGITPFATTTTSSTGSYEFLSLQNGEYIVCEKAQPASAPGTGLPTTGWNESLPNSGTSGNASCAADTSLAAVGYAFTMAGADDIGNDFGNYLNATKAGVKYEDLNADGDRDTGEPGLAGWTIWVDLDDDGVVDLGEPSATTGSDGTYTITGITPSDTSRRVHEKKPAADTQTWFCSQPTASDTHGCYYDEVFSSGEAETGNVFGNYRNGVVSGVKFKDADAGGDKDTTEGGLSGWVIHLFGTDGTGASIHAIATTDATGAYSFTVKPGTYTVCEIIRPTATPAVHAGWVQSHPISGADCTGHDHSGTLIPGAIGHSVTVTSGGTVSGKDFGNTPLSHITITFVPEALLPDGVTAATKATSISCVGPGSGGTSAGSNTNSNTLTSDSVKVSRSSLVCTITFIDP